MAPVRPLTNKSFAECLIEAHPFTDPQVWTRAKKLGVMFLNRNLPLPVLSHLGFDAPSTEGNGALSMEWARAEAGLHVLLTPAPEGDHIELWTVDSSTAGTTKVPFTYQTPDATYQDIIRSLETFLLLTTTNGSM